MNKDQNHFALLVCSIMSSRTRNFAFVPSWLWMLLQSRTFAKCPRVLAKNKQTRKQTSGKNRRSRNCWWYKTEGLLSFTKTAGCCIYLCFFLRFKWHGVWIWNFLFHEHTIWEFPKMVSKLPRLKFAQVLSGYFSTKLLPEKTSWSNSFMQRIFIF